MAEYVEKVSAAVEPYLGKLRTYLNNDATPDFFVQAVAMASNKTGLSRMSLVLGSIGLVFFFLIVDCAFEILALMLGTIYPAYMSFKAIESPEKSDDTQWLVYWTVFAAFSLAEIFADFILFWFPFYYLGKLAFLAWCMYPSRKNNGSVIVYEHIVRKFLVKHEQRIDGHISSANDAVQSGLKHASNMAKNS